MTRLIRRCPFRTTVVEDWENLPVNLTREKEGWLFICQVCRETRCSGYIRDPQSTAKNYTVAN